MTYKLLVLEGITDKGKAVLDAEGWTLDQKKAMPPAELAQIIGDYDAVTIRSGTKITAEVIAAAKKLRVIGRPGVGVDNVDVEAATRAGIAVHSWVIDEIADIRTVVEWGVTGVISDRPEVAIRTVAEFTN